MFIPGLKTALEIMKCGGIWIRAGMWTPSPLLTTPSVCSGACCPASACLHFLTGGWEAEAPRWGLASLPTRFSLALGYFFLYTGPAPGPAPELRWCGCANLNCAYFLLSCFLLAGEFLRSVRGCLLKSSVNKCFCYFPSSWGIKGVFSPIEEHIWRLCWNYFLEVRG